MSTLDTPIEFIQARLPAWLKRATRAEQERFRVLTRQLQRDSDALNALLSDLPPPHAFTLDRLKVEAQVQGWAQVMGFGTVADAIRRARVRRGPYVTDPSLSVVEAAMRNYPPADAVVGGDFDRKGQLYIQGRRGEFDEGGVPSSTAALPMTPASFASLCRRLDVGGAYRQVLESRLPRIGVELPGVAMAYLAYARSLLAHDAYEAKLDGRLDTTGERLLAHVGVQLGDVPVAPLACEVKALQLLSVPLFGARVYSGLAGDAQGVKPVILHLPHDSVAPLQQFPSLQALSAALTERVRRRSYRQGLMHYLPLRLQASLGTALHDQVEWKVTGNLNLFQEIHARITGWREGEPGEPGSERRVRIPTPRVAWSLDDLREDPWHACYHEWRGHTLGNASALMVPTRDQDWRALLARLEYWESLVERSLMVAATFFPFCAPIGMTAAAVGGVRLLYEVFEGIQAFNAGHAQEGIEHLFNALFGVAQGAYLGFVGAVIEPMPVHDGTLRLWNGDVTPFQARQLPPVEAVQDAWGVWRTDDHAWVRIDERYFEVQGSADTLNLRLPSTHRGVTPLLEWSRDGGWQWVHRNPLQRNNLQLLRTFEQTPVELDDSTLVALQRQTGIDEAHLRYLQVQGQPMPAILADTLEEARNWQAVRQVIARLRRGEAPGAGHFRIVQTLADLPGWPEGLTLLYHDGERLYPVGHRTDTRFLRLNTDDLAHDDWAARILAGLSLDEQGALLGQRSLGLRPMERSRLLAERWSEGLERDTHRVTTSMARSIEPEPLAAPITRAFADLPVSIANELVQQASGADRLRLMEGRVSESLGKRCAEALRELRLTHALRALERGESSVDRDRIVMGLLGDMSRLHGRLHLRLWLREWPEPIEVGEQGPLKVIRQEGEQYHPFDESGDDLASAASLEEALLRALPDDARQALGLNIWEAPKLRAQLLAQALEDRQGLRRHLAMKRQGSGGSRPQWINGRLAYPLSGRGRLPLHVWHGSLEQRLERLYPTHAGERLAQLRLDLAADAERQGIDLETLITRLEHDWTVLDQGLRQWEEHDGPNHPAENALDPESRAVQRYAVVREIRRAWRREPHPNTDNHELMLWLIGFNVGELPPINVRLDHIRSLVLSNMGLSEDPSAFLRMFPNINTLHLYSNDLTAIPAAIGELGSLAELSMSDNPLNLHADLFAPLLSAGPASRLATLELSWLSSGAEASVNAQMTAAIGRLAELPALRELVWNNNLHFSDQQLHAITALPHLRALSLVRCGLRLNEQGSAFLRSATALEDLRLSDNNCRELPALPELVNLQELGLARTGLEQVPSLALAMLTRPATELLSIDLRGNRISHVPDEVFAALSRLPNAPSRDIWFDDNPLQSAQIRALRAMVPDAFSYTVDDWLSSFSSLQRALEVARDDAGMRRFIDWFSGSIYDIAADPEVVLSVDQRRRAIALLQHYIGYRNVHGALASRLADFDRQLGQLRTRLQTRILDRQPPDLLELELHLVMFESVMRARLQSQGTPYAGFLTEQYVFWTHRLEARYPENQERLSHMTRERFIDWLSDAQDTFDNNDHAPRPGELTWRPYLGLMSSDWQWGLASWDAVDEALVDAFAEPVNPSRWPRVLLENLVQPEADLPSPWESVTEGERTVWRRVALEPVADVDWAAGRPVTLTEDQLRRTMAIYRSVKSREIEALVRRITTDLVTPWWPQRPQ
ncbi:dermonecrotic toxin domain-containing protein [Pseudomonas citrulli]|uniref:Leucine-rich repeat domain-containing protein n=1 Tax=Pseudomonas citrulli TaxID=3064347 RepID=A0ABT9C5B6_9PSED|nr:DUF6543 domain-containing protein [Pseudomonas sp. K18]MDO7899380.1 leucine-rich repeat domain-containing protein [Pseudomonas sp. K18]